MVRWISLAEAKKATSVFRRLLRPPWWPRRVSPPWLFRTNGRWTISRMAPGENNGFSLMEGLEMSDFYPTKSTECRKWRVFTRFLQGFTRFQDVFCLMGKFGKSCSTPLHPGLIQDAFHLSQGATVSFGLPNGWYKSDGFQQQWGGETVKFIISSKKLISTICHVQTASDLVSKRSQKTLTYTKVGPYQS